MIQRIKRDADEIRRLYVEVLLSLKTIAKIVGCEGKTIKRDLLSMGVPIRGIWEQRKIDEAAGRAITQSDHAKRLNAAGVIGGVRTEEQRKALRSSARSRTGSANPFFGKKHSKETRGRISATALGLIGDAAVNHIENYPSTPPRVKKKRDRKNPTSTVRTGEHNSFYGKKHTLESRLKVSAARGGNGREFVPQRHYTTEWTHELRERIRSRDNYTCQICYVVQSHRKHSVHHIDYDKDNCAESNLVTLCVSCHCKTARNRKAWIAFFREHEAGQDSSEGGYRRA